jgi:uncharacterized protein YndB with AHSA1/START domain
MAEAKPAVKDVVITRIFDAPRELVWRAWTEPERLQEWWGPKDYSSPLCKIDLQVGGKYQFSMRDKEGKTIWGGGVYKNIDPPKELVMTDNFMDADGNIVPASYYEFDGDFPEATITVRLEDLGGKTRMTLTHENLPSAHSEGASIGWNESFDKLTNILE